MPTKLAICLAAVLCLSACPAEEDNNGVDAGVDMAVNSNPAECPSSPPPTAEACESEGLECTYSLTCPCGPDEDFTWTCTGGQLMQPSLACSTGGQMDCPTEIPDMTLPGDMTSSDMPADMPAEDMGEDMAPDMPASTRLVAHGCTYETADDQTGNATVSVTDLLAWDLGHEDFCIIVDQGTVVSWMGAFQLHPLDGGVSPNEDAASPITIAADGAMNGDTVDVTLDAEGDYPYFCGVHDGVMQGVIYVDAP